MDLRAFPPPALDFTVWGIPAPKGNKSAFPVRRKDGGLGVAVREGKSDRPKDWARRVEEVVQGLASSGAQLLDGPLELHVAFYLPKPKSAPKTRRTWPDRKPDLSKLLRAIEDPMNGILIADDARFVRVDASKHYAGEEDTDGRPRAEVRVWTIPMWVLADGAAAAEESLQRTIADVEVSS